MHDNFVDLILENDGLVDDLRRTRCAGNGQPAARRAGVVRCAHRASPTAPPSAGLWPSGWPSLDPADAVTVAPGPRRLQADQRHAGAIAPATSLLIAVAERLQDVVEAGRDGRAVSAATSSSSSASRTIPNELGRSAGRSVFDEPFEIEDRLLTVGAGIGIASTTIERLSRDQLRRADRALYRNKRTGDRRTTHQVFDERC